MVTNPCARRLRRVADDVLGYSLMDLYREAETDYSEYSQVAFLISCLALAEQAGHAFDTEPVTCAGPSFGGKTAVVYAGALAFPEMVLLVARLVRCEEQYFQVEHQDVVTQSIARTPWAALQEILRAMTEKDEWHDISCHIDDDFFMVSMRAASVDRFRKDVRAAGGLPLYTMRPPMHSAAFGPLRRKAEDEVFADFRFDDPRLPIIADSDGSVVRTADGVRAMLLDGFVRAVHWPRAVQSMKGLGVTKVYIAGPDSLFGRVRCTTRNFEVVPINLKTTFRSRSYAMT
jgi:[acyl-carrier-protein] S-malonyltransferase